VRLSTKKTASKKIDPFAGRRCSREDATMATRYLIAEDERGVTVRGEGPSFDGASEVQS
jgi:hypothetical protein